MNFNVDLGNGILDDTIEYVYARNGEFDDEVVPILTIRMLDLVDGRLSALVNFETLRPYGMTVVVTFCLYAGDGTNDLVEWSMLIVNILYRGYIETCALMTIPFISCYEHAPDAFASRNCVRAIGLGTMNFFSVRPCDIDVDIRREATTYFIAGIHAMIDRQGAIVIAAWGNVVVVIFNSIPGMLANDTIPLVEMRNIFECIVGTYMGLGPGRVVRREIGYGMIACLDLGFYAIASDECRPHGDLVPDICGFIGILDLELDSPLGIF